MVRPGSNVKKDKILCQWNWVWLCCCHTIESFWKQHPSLDRNIQNVTDAKIEKIFTATISWGLGISAYLGTIWKPLLNKFIHVKLKGWNNMDKSLCLLLSDKNGKHVIKPIIIKLAPSSFPLIGPNYKLVIRDDTGYFSWDWRIILHFLN